MSSCQSNEVEVELRPFKHQVGGHTCVLELTRTTICKPYIPREVWFYKNEPDVLKDFTPRYLGETSVTCDIQDDRKRLVARVPEEIITRDGVRKSEPATDISIGSNSSTNPRKRRKRSHSETRKRLEAWSSSCIDRQIKKYGYWANNRPQKFIILENLVHDYEHPCLMDLKMGRRQFGEDSNEEKRKLLERRCACSTSATLGFRISGSQSYKASTDSYTFHDKYVGRSLDTDGVIKELAHFFHNGIYLRTDVIRQILVKLENLQSVLMSQTDLFFHSASLLLLYDGANPKCSSGHESSSKHVQCNNLNVTQTCDLNGKEQDFVNGTDQKWINGNERICSESNVTLDSCIFPNSLHEDNEKHPIPVNCCDSGAWGAKFDVRVIDFAHVSEKYINEDEIENIADDTIVFGLIKLKELLTTLL